MKIAVVNKSVHIAEEITQLLLLNHNEDVIWTATNGHEAISKCKMDPPDLILMDIYLTDMNGPEAIQRIMRETPCAILATTENISQNASQIFEAMGEGALDVVPIPVREKTDSGVEHFLQKIKQFKVLLGKETMASYQQYERGQDNEIQQELPPLILIGASTGGPIAVAKILSHLPKNFNAGIVIIQHVDQHFAPEFARWLSEKSSHRVSIAKDGSKITPGVIFIAKTNDHLIMNKNRLLEYTSYPKNIHFRPSIDVFFQSVAKYWPNKSLAILLTGMGKDGAKGLKSLADEGWDTIAQHQDSCVVFGMPKAAMEINAAKKVIPLEQISDEIITFLKKKHESNPWRKE